MSISPIWLGLKRRFLTRLEAPIQGRYRVFTTAFDEVLTGEQLASRLPAPTVDQKQSVKRASNQFDLGFTKERVAIGAAGAKLIRDLTSQMTIEERRSTVVSLLIDHSGSMRGLPMMSALLAVEGAIDALYHAHIATEILGFTTTSWRGGRSRIAWKWAGRPRNPGRLCDLRHIVYGAADRTIRYPLHLRLALRLDVLHENIDGEALLWAASRLNDTRWQRRLICLVSDGAPVDDSTLVSNDDRNLLRDHLEATQVALISQGFGIGTLMIGRDDVPQPSLFERAVEPQEAGKALIRLLGRALLQARSDLE